MTQSNRDESVVSAALGGYSFPAPSRYDDDDWFDKPELLGWAPWFNTAALNQGDIVPRYAWNGWLPGGVPLAVTETWAWRNQFACYDADLFIGHNRTLRGVRCDFAIEAQSGFDRLKTYIPCNPDRSGMFLVRTRGEVDYLEHLDAIDPNVIEGWRGQNIVSNDAWVWPRAQIVAEFRYMTSRGRFWRVYIRNERRLRARHGRAIPYHCLTTFALRGTYFQRAFAELTQFWSRLEVPRGCLAELPMVFTYRMRELMDPESGWWVVAYTEYAMKAAVYILMDVYFNYRLWCLSPHLIDAFEGLDLGVALGCGANVCEFRRLLGVMRSIDYSIRPSDWTARGDNADNTPAERSRRGWGRQGPGADYVYYDPWRREVITKLHAKQLLRNPRPVLPDGHPVGWDHSRIPEEGWASPSVGGAGLPPGGVSGWANDVPEEGAQNVAAPAVAAQQPSAAASASEPVGSSDAYLEGMREMLRAMGNVPESVLNSTNREVTLAFFQGRMSQGGASSSTAPPGGPSGS
jgi:hypothetical protein